MKRIGGILIVAALALLVIWAMPARAQEPVAVRVKAVGWYNVRSRPGLSEPIVGQTYPGQELWLVGRYNMTYGGWLKIEEGGWIYYLGVDGDYGQLPQVSFDQEVVVPTPPPGQQWSTTGRIEVDLQSGTAVMKYDFSEPLGCRERGVFPTLTYTASKGDTLFSIARRYDVSVDALVAVNNIQDPNSIWVGQQLVIP